MELFIAWYYGDAKYQSIDENCSVALSLTNVPRKWTVCKWNFAPRKLLVGSGPSDRRKKIGLEENRQIVKRQFDLVDDFDGDVFLINPDFRLFKKHSKKELMQRLKLNLLNAQRHMDEFQKQGPPKNVRPLGVIHGFDEKSLIECAHSLKEMGYEYFALGSQETISRLDRGSIAAFINTLSKEVNYLHVLGVSSMDLFREYSISGVSSIDSSTPIKEAFTNGFYFSQPLQRYKICTERLNVNWIRGWGYANLVCNPIWEKRCGHLCDGLDARLKKRVSKVEDIPSCDCPVCRKFGIQEGLLLVGKKIYNNRRALHSYFHIKREIYCLLDNPFREREGALEVIK